MDVEDAGAALLAPSAEVLASVKVFPLIPHLKRDVLENIDSALTWDQLTASDINFAIIRPLVFKYAALKNLAVVYACLVVRAHFIALAASDIAHASLMTSRADMCELMAMKLLRNFASSKVELAAVLTTSWSPIAGAPPEVVEEVRDSLGGKDENLDDPTSALEVAIATKSKKFLASSLVQVIVNHIYSGRIVFSTVSNRSLLADNYKPRAIEIYDSRTAPFLDHYRLRVPKYGAILEFVNFALLLLTFVLCLSNQDYTRVGEWEIIFGIFAFAFVLEEYTASREHGWSIYIASMWNVFDASFILIFLTYFVLRVKGIVQGDAWYSEMAFDILSCGACILFPRLAFFAIKHNVVVLALRGMIAEFVFFMAIAAVCFSGLLFTLWILSHTSETPWTVKRIAWLMVQIWFGNTYLSFAQAESFHKIFGPILMTGFAALSNTLLLTILISILSNTFARIDSNANEEYLFQFTITTIEGVKSDALFSYQPPFNLFAYLILLPLSWTCTPRGLHSANVFLIKLTSFPILIVIGLYERYFASGQKLRESSREAGFAFYNSLPQNIKKMPIIEALIGTSSYDLYDAIFDVEFSADSGLFDESDDETAENDNTAGNGRGQGVIPRLRSLASRDSIKPFIPPIEPGTPKVERRRRVASTPHRPARTPGVSLSPSASPRLRPRNDIPPPPALIASVSEGGFGFGRPPSVRDTSVYPGPQPSPLTRLFSTRRPMSIMSDERGQQVSEEVLAGIKKVEGMLEGMKDASPNGSAQKLKDEMKELQERQARIENLLMTLTRGMRNETGRGSRHNSAGMS